MSAQQELIAAALTAADALRWIERYRVQREDLREACARAMVQPVGEAPMPPSVGMRFDGTTLHKEIDVRAYGDDRYQQGYAAGVAACVAALVALKPQSGVNPDGTAWLLPISRQDCVEAVAALRGEVKP